MARFGLSLILAISLLACSAKTGVESPDNQPVNVTQEPAKQPNQSANKADRNGPKPLGKTDLTGEWDIVRFEDYVPDTRLKSDGKRTAYVDFFNDETFSDKLRVSFYIGCNYSGNYQRFQSDDKRNTLIHVPTRTDHTATEIGCSKTLAERDKAFFGMMYASPQLERMGEHRLRLWTDDHELVLLRSEFGQRYNQISDLQKIHGEWQIISAYRGGLGIGGQAVTDVLRISKDIMQFGDFSPHIVWPRIMFGNGKIYGTLEGDGSTLEKCDAASKDARSRLMEDQATCFILQTITGRPVAEPAGSPLHIRLSSGEYGILIKKIGE